MKKLVLLTIVAVVLGYTAKAQDAEEFREHWQETITVPASQTTTIEKLFTAWGKQFPGQYVDVFNKFKKTGKAAKHLTDEQKEYLKGSAGIRMALDLLKKDAKIEEKKAEEPAEAEKAEEKPAKKPARKPAAKKPAKKAESTEEASAEAEKAEEAPAEKPAKKSAAKKPAKKGEE